MWFIFMVKINFKLIWINIKIIYSKLLSFHEESLFDFEEKSSKSQSLTGESLFNSEEESLLFSNKEFDSFLRITFGDIVSWMLNKDDQKYDLFFAKFSS